MYHYNYKALVYSFPRIYNMYEHGTATQAWIVLRMSFLIALHVSLYDYKARSHDLR